MSDKTQLNDALASNYLLVDLQLRSWSGKSTDRSASDEVISNKGATRDSGRFVKNLFAGADGELRAVNQQATAIRAYVYSRTLPWSNNTDGAKRGDRLISAKQSFEFLKELNEIKREYDAAVSKLQAMWDTRKAEAIQNLGGLAREDDYPDPNTLPDMFSVSVDLRPVPTMGDFKRVNVPAELAEALGERHMQLAEAQVSNALDDLKKRLLESLQRMGTQLKKAGAGEKTRLYDSLVTNLQDLVGLARTMNVKGKNELSDLADKIEAQLLQHPVEVYRNHPEKAVAVAHAADQIAVEAALEQTWK
jgi:molybdopterin converting factor small subunit